MVKLLPAPRELPNHRTSFSLTEGRIDFEGTFALMTLTIYLHRKDITSMSSGQFVLSLLSPVLLVSSYLCCVFPLWCTCLLCKSVHLEQESLLLEPVRDQKHQCQNSGELVSVSWTEQNKKSNLKALNFFYVHFLLSRLISEVTSRSMNHVSYTLKKHLLSKNLVEVLYFKPS